MARVVFLLSYGWLFCIQLSLQLSYFEPLFCNVGDPCELCNVTVAVNCAGKMTAPYLFCDTDTNLVSQSVSMSLECWQGNFRIKHCAKNTYYIKDRGCVDPTIMPFFQGLSVSGSGRVGDVCQYNTDCLSGMYCSGGMCTCLSTYILRESYCYEKINPNQPGCTYDVQCESVWPGSKCSMDSSVGTCRCPEETHVARETRDGWVCISLKDQGTGGTAPLYFVCPLPEGAGFKIALNDPNPEFGSFPVSCTVGSSATVEPIAGLHGGAGCMWPTNGEYLGDIYDCIHTSPHVQVATKFPQSSYAASADGVCCPSRTLACIQPQATGPNPTESRWWYNSVTGTCQQFMWDPAATEAKYHSANNFKTIQHCESYCRDTCQRGPPQYSNEAVVHSERPLTTCGTTGCANDFQCTAVGSQHLCCPTPAVICSARGGRPYDSTPRPTIFHQGFKVTTGKETIRFYYDPALGRCHDFIYQGAGGNFNNFLSKHECEMFCSRLQCERGSPLRIGEDSQRCQTNGQCPSSHECKADQGVCCPRKQTICAQPLRVGDCTENVKRYYYNAKSRQCQMFEYTGCQGNDNNFNSHLDCQNFCKNAIPEPKCVQGQAYKDQFGNFVSCSNGMGCPANYDCTFDGSQWGCCPLKSYTCTLNSDSGVQCGAGSTFKFFYNPSTQNCESFQYNGCDGNSNNFATRESCEAYCSVGGCPNGGLPQRDHAGMMAVCSVSQPCHETHECVPVFSGVTMIHRCCPTRAYMCSLPPQQGTQCAANFVSRYYFNIVTGQCSTFQFGGCDGNSNNFLTVQQCRSFCMSNSCPAGNIAYVDPNTQMPINCNEALSNSCPNGFTCTFNSLINNHVCCGATDLGVCPEGEKAYIDTFDMTARECAINIEASCPSNYLCRFHMQKNKYYCCASHSGKTCPVGKFLFKDSRSSHPTRCTMGRADQCPDGYSCQSYLSNALQGFCCSSSSICPDDAEYVVDDHSMQPRACTMGSFVSCPAGFVCRSASSSTEGFCCRSGMTSTGIVPDTKDGCPPGNYVHMLNGEIAPCDPFNPPNAPCPGGYTCQWSIENQRYQCCGSNPAPPPVRISDGCPSGQIAFREKDSVRVCTAGAEQACPTGYFCQFSSTNHQFQCCGVAGGCMNNAVAFVGVSGEPEKCVVGQSNCPRGFACRRSIAGHHVCCTVENVANCTEDEIELDGSCQLRVSPGDNCLANEQCMGGSVCRESMCVCPAKTTLVGGFCQKEIACGENQILFTGMCHNMARVGEGCVVGKQCPDGAGCMDGVCECKRGLIERKGACIAQPNQIVQSKLTTATCSKSGSKPLRDEDTGRVIYCSLSSRACPSGYHCQINSKKTQYMCCSDVKGTVESTTTVTTTASSKNVCPFGRIPYLLNGSPQSCNGQRCPQGYECLYKNQNYYCCSAKSSTARTTKSENIGIDSKLEDECLRGAVLIHPSTRTPVLCNPGSRSCPIGYACQKSLKSVSYVCCSSKNSDRPYTFHRFAAAPCDGYNVLVSRIVNGRIEKQCERSCPHPQVPIGGICFEMKNYAKQMVKKF